MMESPAQVFLGQAGWDDDDVVVFPGSMEDDGHTLVRCQLFSGRDITKEHTPDRAQGTKLVCHVADGVFKIPPKNARVYILIPHGMEGVEGAGVIIASVTPGVERTSKVTEGEVTLSGSSGAGRVRVKTDGSVTLFTTDTNENDGTAIFLRISPNHGFEFCAPFGRIRFDNSGFHVATAAGPSIDMGGIDLSGIPGIGALPAEVLGALSGYCTITCPTFTAESTTVMLGAGAIMPLLYTPASIPAGPAPGAGVILTPGPCPAVQYSNTIYVSP